VTGSLIRMTPQTLSERLETGDVIPPFSGVDQNGEPVSSDALVGSKLVLYFYPRAFTPGCTTESCDFRDRHEAFSAKGYTILGFSPDKADKLEKFRKEYDLPFDLVSDPEHTIASSFGAYGKKTNYGKEYMGIIRSTFIVDEAGKVEDAYYNVRAKGHAERIATAAGI
jgi:peroxiredoxin Q/BCP